MISSQRLRELALIPGPPNIPQPYSSVNVQDIVEYHTTDISTALLQLDGVELLSEKIESMWDWKASFKRSSASICLEMTCLGQNDEFWGGFQLNGTCQPAHILIIWDALKDKGFTAVWLHDSDCNMYTRDGFINKFSGTA